jgi:hypothetical protein
MRFVVFCVLLLCCAYVQAKHPGLKHKKSISRDDTISSTDPSVTNQLPIEAIELFNAISSQKKANDGYGRVWRGLEWHDYLKRVSHLQDENEHAKKLSAPSAHVPTDAFAPAALLQLSSRDAPAPAPAAADNNPSYILPVDPYNFIPFFNGYSNVNPFSVTSPPPAYLYPQTVAARMSPFNQVPSVQSMAQSYLYPPPYPANYPNVVSFAHPMYPFGPYAGANPYPSIPVGTNTKQDFPQFAEVSSRRHKTSFVSKSFSRGSKNSSPAVAHGCLNCVYDS